MCALTHGVPCRLTCDDTGNRTPVLGAETSVLSDELGQSQREVERVLIRRRTAWWSDTMHMTSPLCIYGRAPAGSHGRYSQLPKQHGGGLCSAKFGSSQRGPAELVPAYWAMADLVAMLRVDERVRKHAEPSCWYAQQRKRCAIMLLPTRRVVGCPLNGPEIPRCPSS